MQQWWNTALLIIAISCQAVPIPHCILYVCSTMCMYACTICTCMYNDGVEPEGSNDTATQPNKLHLNGIAIAVNTSVMSHSQICLLAVAHTASDQSFMVTHSVSYCIVDTTDTTHYTASAISDVLYYHHYAANHCYCYCYNCHDNYCTRPLTTTAHYKCVHQGAYHRK
jgi:hypothetical protein